MENQKMHELANAVGLIGAAKSAWLSRQKITIAGISFSELLAGKVHDGSKTMTRRVVNGVDGAVNVVAGRNDTFRFVGPDGNDFAIVPCPYQVGQILYIREPWRGYHGFNHYKPSEFSDGAKVEYLTDGNGELKGRYRQARFMPKRFARTFIRVTGIDCQRLWDISEADAIAEGVFDKRALAKNLAAAFPKYTNYSPGNPHNGPYYAHAVNSFASLWDFVNKEKGKPKWADNPWVWVISFERVEMPNPWNESVLVVLFHEQMGCFSNPITRRRYWVALQPYDSTRWWFEIGSEEIGKEETIDSMPYESEAAAEKGLNDFVRASILNPSMLNDCEK